MTGHDAEAHEAIHSYLASVPSGPKTVAAIRARINTASMNAPSDPRFLEFLERLLDGLRKAGMPEE